MNKLIGIIVDGQSDYLSFNKRFEGQYRIVKTDGPRGETVSPRKIITSARKQISILKSYSCRKVLIVSDFEDRKCLYDTFVEDLYNAISEESFGVKVTVAIPNRMIENWYLADIAFLSRKKRFLKKKIKQKRFEGKHGKKELKRFFERGFTYKEVEHGPQLFEIIRFPKARKMSSSLDCFLNLISEN